MADNMASRTPSIPADGSSGYHTQVRYGNFDGVPDADDFWNGADIDVSNQNQSGDGDGGGGDSESGR